MKNPIVAWREQKELSRRDVALLARMDYAQVATSELGLVSRPNRSILAIVRQLDGDAAATTLEEAYYHWRTAEAEAVSQQLVR